MNRLSVLPVLLLALVACRVDTPTPLPEPVDEFDLLISGGEVFDGDGGPGRAMDLGVRGGRIVAIGDLDGRRATRVIDAGGLAVAPGFIDFHSHSDDELLLGAAAQSKIRQGVTTEVVGQDGGSYAPLTEPMRAQLHDRLQRHFGVDVDWRDFAGYFAALERAGLVSNVISMVGQGTLRAHVIGEEDRPATPAEIRRMQQLAREAFAQGAFGISSGLEYTPGSFADTAELTALCKAMAGQGVYATHLRNEDDTVLEALDEAIDIARGAGVPLHIAHMKASGARNYHKLPEMLARLDAARAGGMAVTADRYPYVAYNTGLASLFPLRSRDGGSERFLARLRDPAQREAIEAAVLAKIERIGGWDRVQIAGLPENPRREAYEGADFAALTADDRDPYELLVELITIEGGGGSLVGFAMSEENTARLLACEHTIVASDGSALADEDMLAAGSPHPRAFGTFPRFLGHYVRDAGLVPLGEAIRRITALPAAVLGLTDRGRIAAGYWADLVVFDPQRIADRATWEAPQQYPLGIPYVIVNGALVVDGGAFSGTLAGRVLRLPFDAEADWEPAMTGPDEFLDERRALRADLDALKHCVSTYSCPQDDSDPKAAHFLLVAQISDALRRFRGLIWDSEDYRADARAVVGEFIDYPSGHVQEQALAILATLPPDRELATRLVSVLEDSRNALVVRDGLEELRRYPELADQIEAMIVSVLRRGSPNVARDLAGRIGPWLHAGNIDRFRALADALPPSAPKTRELRAVLDAHVLPAKG